MLLGTVRGYRLRRVNNFDFITTKIESALVTLMHNRFRPLLTKSVKQTYLNHSIGKLFEKTFFTFCETVAIQQFVECGAHEAHASQEISRILPDCSVFAYEANPFVFETYRKELEGTGISYLNLAVSNSTGNANFSIKDKDTKSWSSEGYLSPEKDVTSTKSFSIATTTLDSEWESRFKRVRTAIWVDVEGSNRMLIEGGTSFFKEADIVCIFIEVQTSLVWPHDLNPYEVCAILEEKGFVAVARDWPRHWGCNIFFVHRNFYHHAHTIIEEFYRQIPFLNISFFPQVHIKSLLGALKRSLLSLLPRSSHKRLHQVAALLGSRSSSDH